MVISEFLAANSSTLRDDFGESSDYVEIYNGTSQTINLAGYALTDSLENKAQWVFPATNLTSGQHLLVWASGRDRRVAGGPLHTNFKLSSTGESLALIKPDHTTVLHQYDFGPQIVDQTQGLEAEVESSSAVLALGAPARYFVPANNALTNLWTLPAFDDRAWRLGRTAFGFDTNLASMFSFLISTDVKDLMYLASPQRAGLYVRIPFTVENPQALLNLALELRYADGFVAYLNGTEVARRGLARNVSPSFSTVSSLNRSNDAALTPETIPSLALDQSLRAGTNLLAIHAFNRDPADGDFLLAPEIRARRLRYATNAVRSFAMPTPGVANVSGTKGIAGSLHFSISSRIFIDSFDLTIAAAEPSPMSEVRYTLDGSVPGPNSLLYQNPLPITNSMQIRARLFEPGFLPGRVRTEAYARLAPEMRRVSSDLPLILVHSYGAGRFNENIKKGCILFVHEPRRGRASFTNASDLIFRAGLKIRGSSSAGNPKYNWALDCWDEDDRERNLPLLGMPPGSEWTFHAPYSTDTSLIADPFASSMSQAAGRYAARFRFAELYLNERPSGNPQATIAPTNYFGVYNILERIGIGPNRVAIEKLTDQDVEPPAVTGGYLLSIDRNIDGPQGFTAGGQSFVYTEPTHEVMVSPQREAQRAYLTAYLNEFTAVLDSAHWTNPVTGYAPYIDAGSWIDFHLMQVISVNGDGLGLSTYFYKPRNGPITFGPIWDFDKAFGWAEVRHEAPLIWEGGKGFFYYPWWGRLFLDPNFWQAYIDRFQELNAGPYSIPGLMALIDGLNDQVKESAIRDLVRWKQPKRGGTQEGEIAYFKDWLTRRIRFMETNFVARPDILERSGPLIPGTQVEIAGPPGATILYTLDGSDPRALHGSVAANAKTYTGPIPVSGETRLVARARDVNRPFLTGAAGGHPPLGRPWSGPVTARYFLDAPAAEGDLMVSEMNYFPAPPTPKELNAKAALTAQDFEFIEIQNISSRRIDLFGSRFMQGITFGFTDSPLYTLAPGAHLLLVKNPDAFALRYGVLSNIAGIYRGSLADQGQTIRLEDANGNRLLEFAYDARWHPATAGLGFTLVRTPPYAKEDTRDAWGPGNVALGSPGRENSPAANLPRVVINEALANPASTGMDAVELLNTSSVPADVSGWFLTDDPRQPKKYKIPDKTVLAPGAFWVASDTAFGTAGPGTIGFQLSRTGDDIWLFAADVAGTLLGYSHGFEFGASETDVSWGRYVASDGQEQFVAQTSPTLGARNSEPRIGPVELREIMYHPPDIYENGAFWDNEEDEFIEIANVSNTPVSLAGSAPGRSWHLRGTVDFDFPSEFVLEPNGAALLVNFDPRQDTARLAAWRQKWGLSASIPVLGPFRGKMDNSAGEVTLLKPGSEDRDRSEVSYVVVDHVAYRDHAPWPAAADGGGASLERKGSFLFGNDAANWIAALPSPGQSPGLGVMPLITVQPESQTVVGGTRVNLSVAVAAGLGSPLKFQWRRDGANVSSATNALLVLNPVKVSDAGHYSVVVVNSHGSVESAAATLKVLAPPTIVRHPEGLNVRPGSTASFAVAAQGTGKLSYQWLFNGIPIAGAISMSLTLRNVQGTETGPYTVRVSDSIGSSTSQPAQLNVLVRPTFATQPQSQIALVGDTIELRVEVSGLAPFSYRWRKGAATIPGATNAVLTLQNVQLGDAGSYGLIVTNLASGILGVVSQFATVIVMADSDHDRAGDEWEAQFGYSPANPGDGNLDDDGDGQTTREEFLAGTNPHDRQSCLRIDNVRLTGQGTEISFIAQANRGYTVQFREALDSGAWQALKQLSGRDQAQQETVIDPVAPGKARWYRLVTPPQF
ncbi:MAG: lamin tail domain-containing protein [Verrucomicrobia bacterium]|nr:lamin tail domain-containing protein [Verrucomicrobiota bacterium]